MTPSASGLRVEIAVQDVEGARVAAQGGADRVELGQALALGGLSASRGLLTQVAAIGVPFRALIRPRAGGYEYTRAEVAVMARDIETALECGANGVVIGALVDSVGLDAADAALDQATLRHLADVAAGWPVIIHRCVDILIGAGTDAADLVDQVRNCGGTGVLTSGGATRAVQGRDAIAALATAGGADLEVVAGGGVRPDDVPALAATGVEAIHLSAGRQTSAGPSGPGGGADEYMATDPAGVRAVRAAVDALR